jgi:hypothetical protein
LCSIRQYTPLAVEPLGWLNTWSVDWAAAGEEAVTGSVNVTRHGSAGSWATASRLLPATTAATRTPGHRTATVTRVLRGPFTNA